MTLRDLHRLRGPRRLRELHDRSGPRGRELIAIGLMALVVLPAATVFLQLWGERDFYQHYFAPAVMFACGEGFHDVAGSAQSPEMSRFLNRETRTLDCAAVRGLPTKELTDFQEAVRWLITGTALVWRVWGGPSWDVMLPMHLALLTLSLLGAYGLLRLVGRRAVAAPLAALAVLWPFHLGMLPLLRDYSKAPFLWLGCFGLAVGVLASTYRRRLIGAAIGGIAVGVGIGFRPDVMVLVPVAVVVLMLQPWEGARRLWTGPAAAAVFLACFTLAAAPILPGYGDSGNNTGIVSVEGLTPEYQDRVGIGSDLYDTSYHYNDTYTAGLAAAHGRLVEHEPGPYTWGTPEFDSAANATYSEQVWFLPADTMLRTATSAFASLRLGTVPPFSSALVGLPLLFGALVLLGARRPRALALVLVLGLPLAGVTALQWHYRHAFHLALVSFLLLAALIEIGLRLLARRRGGPPYELPPRRALAVTAGVLAGVLAVGLVAYAVTRSRQDSRVDAYLAQLERQPRDPVPASAAEEGGRSVLPLPQDWVKTWDGVPDNRSALLRVAVGRCTAPAGALTLRYAAPNSYLDYTNTVPVQPAGGAVWYVVAPVINGTRPDAIELAGALRCPLRADRVLARDLPLLLNVVLDSSTRSGPRHAHPRLAWLLFGLPSR